MAFPEATGAFPKMMVAFPSFPTATMAYPLGGLPQVAGVRSQDHGGLDFCFSLVSELSGRRSRNLYGTRTPYPVTHIAFYKDKDFGTCSGSLLT